MVDPCRYADAVDAIADSYLIQLRDKAFPAASRQGTALAERHGAEVTRVFQHAVNGFAARMTRTVDGPGQAGLAPGTSADQIS
ncbi:hypothetical protein [Kibdelosporangium aridum]|uniref:Uncharacterized protein n=1 Tax=Kibdelosporangium aridum TaxID=2030 RepID=A0A1W2FYR8_KIBAR|nr:hypothetical protein [Kibdelosporangium aridum]SMD27109.1 hypothetical protein SAMN05661093_10706 [Kibdelosporangium aridum]